MTTIPFSDSTVATSDSSGNVTFTGFQQPRENMWRTGSLSVIRSDGTPVAPTTVLPVTWYAKVGATIWGGWYNDQPSNLVQTNGPPVRVTGTNLAPSTSYQCVYTGYDSDAPPPLSPLPVPAPPPTAPRVIVSNNVALPAGQTVQIGTDQPVIVGTGLEIFEALTAHQGGGNLVRLYIRWSVDGSFVDPIEWTMDLGDAVSMRGLILPHLAPFVRFLAAAQNGQEQISLTVVTGLPPIVRSPIVPTGVLWNAAGSVGAGATATVAIPPYVGQVAWNFSPNNTTGFGVYVIPKDYLGVDQAQIKITQGWPAGTGPFVTQGIVYLPPGICRLVIDNSAVGAPTSYNTSGVALGP